MSTPAAGVDARLVDVNTVLGYTTARPAGTGMVLTSTGIVLTNSHVIEGATSISVTDIGNRQTYKATVVGHDSSMDVAAIKLAHASGLQTVSIGNSSSASVGDPWSRSIMPEAPVASRTLRADRSRRSTSIMASDAGSARTERLKELIESSADVQQVIRESRSSPPLDW